MTPPHNKDEDTQERRRRNYDEYYPSLSERVTILEQKQKMQTDALRNEMDSMESALKERIVELNHTNTALQNTVQELRMQVSELKIRSGIVASIASVVTVVAFFLLELFRRKISGE